MSPDNTHEMTTVYNETLVASDQVTEMGGASGRRLTSLADDLGSMASRRYCDTGRLTSNMDLDFKMPAYEGDVLVSEARVSYTGNTSMVVSANLYAERVSEAILPPQPVHGERQMLNGQTKDYTNLNRRTEVDEDFIADYVQELATIAGLRSTDGSFELEDWEMGFEEPIYAGDFVVGDAEIEEMNDEQFEVAVDLSAKRSPRYKSVEGIEDTASVGEAFLTYDISNGQIWDEALETDPTVETTLHADMVFVAFNPYEDGSQEVPDLELLDEEDERWHERGECFKADTIDFNELENLRENTADEENHDRHKPSI